MPTLQRSLVAKLATGLASLAAILSLALYSAALRAQPIAVDGIVSDELGRPLAGATVELKPILAKVEVAQLLLSGKDEVAAAASARTDASGHYLLQAPGPGMWVVLASAKGLTTVQRTLLPLLEPTSLGEARLAPAVEVRVRVVDPSGRPVAGAIVAGAPAYRRWRSLGGSSSGWGVPGRRTLSAADGGVSFRRGRDQVLSFSAAAPGFLPVDAEEDDLPSRELRLAAGCARPVQALDPQRKPVAGVIVSGSGEPVGETGSDGAVSIAVPCGRRSALRWSTADGRRGLETFDTPAAAAEGTSPSGAGAPILLPIPARPAVLAGKVLDRVSRKAIVGAWIWPASDPGAVVRSAAGGAYLIPLPDPQDTRLQAVAEHTSRSDEAWIVPRGVPRAGTFAGLVLLLRPTAAIEGVVVDQVGAPIAGALLTLGGERYDAVQLWGYPVQRTGADGVFRLRAEVGLPFLIQATHPQRPDATSAQAALKPGERRSGIRLVLASGRAAYGRVIDSAENPVAGARVSLTHSEGSDTDSMMLSYSGDGAESGLSATTGADGRFSFDKIPEPPLDLEVRAAGFAPLTVPGIALPPPAAPKAPAAPPGTLAPSTPKQVAAPRPADLGTVILRPGFHLRGQVVDKEGRPVASARIRPLPEGFGSRFRWVQGMSHEDEDEVVSGLDGRFEVDDLDGGHQVSLQVYKKGYQAARIANLVVPSDEAVKVVLLRTFTLRGAVSDEDGNPLPNAVVVQVVSDSAWGRPGMQRRNHPIRQGTTDAEGRFEIEIGDPGKLRIEATAPGFLNNGVDVDVPEPRDVDGVDIVLHPGAVLFGRIAGVDGQPLDHATVTVGGEEAFFSRGSDPTVQAGENGEYRAEGLELGKTEATFQRSGYSRLSKSVEIRPGENRLDVRLEKALLIEGRVSDPSGRPIGRARVVAESGEESRAAESQADGSFSIDDVETGTYSVYADHSSYGSSERASVTISGSSAGGIELRLTDGGTLRGRILGLKFEQLPDVMISATIQRGTGTQISFKEGRVDYQGEYKLSGLEAGEWQVSAHYGNRFARGVASVPEGGEAALDLEFKEGYPLSGRVTRHGEPIEGATVMALDREGKATGYGQTDSRGAFRIDGLRAGTYFLQIIARNTGLRHQQEIEIPVDGEIVIDLPSARVAGRVVDQTSRAPLAGVVVSLRAAAAAGDPFGRFLPPISSESVGDGSFLLDRVSPGHYTLTGTKDGYTRGELEVEVGEDRDASLELQLRRSDRQTVRIVGAPGVGPIVQAEIALVDAASGQVLSQNSVRLDESGQAEIDALPGTWELAVMSGNSATALQTVTLPGPVPTVTLTPASFLSVRVPALGDLLGGPFLELRDASGRLFRTFSYTGVLESRVPLFQGVAMVPNLPAGSWSLTVTAPDGRTFSGTAVSAPDKPIDVELEAAPAAPPGR